MLQKTPSSLTERSKLGCECAKYVFSDVKMYATVHHNK